MSEKSKTPQKVTFRAAVMLTKDKRTLYLAAVPIVDNQVMSDRMLALTDTGEIADYLDLWLMMGKALAKMPVVTDEIMSAYKVLARLFEREDSTPAYVK